MISDCAWHVSRRGRVRSSAISRRCLLGGAIATATGIFTDRNSRTRRAIPRMKVVLRAKNVLRSVVHVLVGDADPMKLHVSIPRSCARSMTASRSAASEPSSTVMTFEYGLQNGRSAHHRAVWMKRALMTATSMFSFDRILPASDRATLRCDGEDRRARSLAHDFAFADRKRSHLCVHRHACAVATRVTQRRRVSGLERSLQHVRSSFSSLGAMQIMFGKMRR